MAFDRVGFLHVPKAAGTSVTIALRNAFADPRPFRCDMDPVLFGEFTSFDEISADTRSRIYTGDGSDLAYVPVLAGHFAWRTITATIPPAQVMCVVREPRVRLLSHYFYWTTFTAAQREAYLPWTMLTRVANVSLEQFLSEPWLAPQSDEVLTRMLVYPNRQVPNEGFLRTINVLRRRRVEQRARSLFSGLGLVVPLEIGARLGSVVSAWCGRPVDIQHHNRTERTATVDIDALLTPTVMRLLAERSRHDRRLWRWACTQHGLDPDRTEQSAFDDYVASIRN